MTKLNALIPELEKANVKLITIATDKGRPLKKLSEKEKYNFTVIPDSEAKISHDYKVFGKPVDFDMIKAELAIPSTFLINRNREIVWRFIGTKTIRPSMDVLMEAIETKL